VKSPLTITEMRTKRRENGPEITAFRAFDSVSGVRFAEAVDAQQCE
jgi:hypothetical protein